MTIEPPALLIGAHMSIAGGLPLAFRRGEELGCAAMQVFTKNANRWQGKPLAEEEVGAFRLAWKSSPIGPVIAHDSYLINLAAPDEDVWRKSIAAFADEMHRCAALGIPYLVMHPGAHLGTGESVGLARIAAAFRRLFDEGPAGVTVLLENTAGQGSYLGGRFEHLAQIMEQVPGGHFGVCFDTCHALAAGYDLSTAEGYAAVMDEFDRRIGIPLLSAFHLNDAKKGLGSRVDRHEHIGRGAIGHAGFRALMRDERFRAVPKILETPKGDDTTWDRMNLATLRQLAAG
ncbi:MAG: deoxyribonuclease IV [Desulfuromonadales bacterium]|jgi:deoxyribonuclease-4